MSGIEELRQRVVDAEQRFGLFNEQRAKYSQRLIALMTVIEERIRDQQGEIAQQRSAAERHKAEIGTQKAMVEGQVTAIAQQAEEIEKLRPPPPAWRRKTSSCATCCTACSGLSRPAAATT